MKLLISLGAAKTIDAGLRWASGSTNDRLSWSWAEVARVRPEAQVEFRDLVDPAVCSLYPVRVAAVTDRRHLALQRSALQIGHVRRRIRHDAIAAPNMSGTSTCAMASRPAVEYAHALHSPISRERARQRPVHSADAGRGFTARPRQFVVPAEQPWRNCNRKPTEQELAALSAAHPRPPVTSTSTSRSLPKRS